MGIIKKIFFVFSIILAILIGLQFFTNRDFTQLPLAFEKYQLDGELSSLFDDIGLIFKGQRIKEGAIFYNKYANKVMYRWKDELGEVHITEVKPKNTAYEEIKLGELKIQVQEGLTQEEIEQALDKPKK